MRRRLISAGLAVGALAMLGALVLGSRPIPIEAHLAHRQAIAAIERAREDYAALLSSLEAARSAGEAPGEGARALLTRLEQTPETLGAALFLVRGRPGDEQRLQQRLDSYTGTVNDAASLMRGLLGEQDTLIASLQTVRDAGPAAVERMRDVRLDAPARATFELVAATLDYARPAAPAGDRELRGRIAALRADPSLDANMPVESRALLDAVEAVLTSKDRIADLSARLREVPFASSSDRLAAAADGLYRDTLASVGRARTLLAIYAVLLLGAAAVIAFRLSQSYRSLNRVNAELESLNSSLEQRVAERTEALEAALRELKESHVQLVQAEKMSSLGQLVAGISHEINTPLLYLANNAELLRERIGALDAFIRRSDAAFKLRAEDYPDRRAYQVALANALKQLHATLVEDDLIASVEEAGELLDDSSAGLEDLTEMAQGLKDFSRLDRAPVESFDVNAGLERSLLIARSALKHKANVGKFYGEIPEIRCAPSQLNQVFLNLLTNAAQAIEEHGEIVVRTEMRGEDHVAITISDTGCGIPPENLAKICDPFFTTKTVGTGTGLGLSIVDQIVTAHGGTLEIESEPGRGSAFTLVLPIAGADAGQGAEDGATDAGGDASPGAELAAAG